jgi:hypothetical protein
MTRDERYIIENADAGDDLDVLLATRRCSDCADLAFLFTDGLWLCQVCADERAIERTTDGDVDRAADRREHLVLGAA